MTAGTARCKALGASVARSRGRERRDPPSAPPALRMPNYDPTSTLREARGRYFAANGLGEGGYEDKWVRFALGPIRFAIPNTAGRVHAVRYHDLHHVVTGYDT